MKKAKSILMTVAALFLFTQMVAAQRGPDQRRGRGFTKPRSGQLLMVLKSQQERLGLTEEQLAEIKELGLQMEEKNISLRNELNIQQLELKKAMLNPESRDYSQIQAVLTKIAQIRTDMTVARMKHQDAVRNVLTPEQKEALQKLGRARRAPGREFLRDRGIRRAPRSPRIRRIPEDFRK